MVSQVTISSKVRRLTLACVAGHSIGKAFAVSDEEYMERNYSYAS
jgi:hypothetical protein